MKFRLIQVLPHVVHASARNVRDLIDMKLNFNFRVLTCDAWRMAAACGVAMLLVACSGVSLPEPVLAKPRVSKPRADALRNETLASALRDAQALPLAEASAVTEDFLRALQAEVRLHDWKKPIEITGAAGSWELSFDSQGLESQGKPEWSPGLFDRLIPTGEMEVEGYRRILQGEGAGAAIVLAFEDIEKLRQMYAFRPRNGLYLPGTAILEFGEAASPAGPTPVRLRIFNTLEERSARLGERSVPLAWNTTAALEFNLQNPYLLKNGLNGLLRPDRRTDDPDGDDAEEDLVQRVVFIADDADGEVRPDDQETRPHRHHHSGPIGQFARQPQPDLADSGGDEQHHAPGDEVERGPRDIDHQLRGHGDQPGEDRPAPDRDAQPSTEPFPVVRRRHGHRPVPLPE